MVYQERDRERKTENQVEFGKTSVNKKIHGKSGEDVLDRKKWKNDICNHSCDSR